MPARLRLPARTARLRGLATVVLSLDALAAEKDDVRDQARERAHAARLRRSRSAPDAAVLALRASAPPTTPRRRSAPQAFSTFARVPLARPEIAAVGWVPLVAAAQRGEVEAGEQIRIEAPAGALVHLSARAPGAGRRLSGRARPRLRPLARRGAPAPPARPAAAALGSGPPDRRRPDRRLRLRPRLRASDLPLRTAAQRRDALRASSQAPSSDERAGPQAAIDRPAARARRPRLRRTDRARARPRRRRDRSGRARRPDLAHLARPRRRLPARTRSAPPSPAWPLMLLLLVASGSGFAGARPPRRRSRPRLTRERTSSARALAHAESHDRRGAAHPPARRRRNATRSCSRSTATA